MHAIFLQRIFSLMLLLSAVQAVAQDYTHIVHSKREKWHDFIHERFYGATQIRDDSVAYFTEVAKLRQVAQKAGDQQLLLEADFLKYNFLSSRGYPTYLEEIKVLEHKITASGIQQLQARIYQAIGLHYFYELKDYPKAIEKLSQSYEVIKLLSQEDLPDKQELLYNIAYVYYQVDYNKAALEFINLAEKEPAQSYYPQLPLNILNTKGMIYKNKGDLDTAISVFKKVYEMAKNADYQIWECVALNNLAEIYLFKNEYDNALSSLNWTLSPDDNKETVDVLLKKHRLQAMIYIHLNKEEDFKSEVVAIEQLLRLVKEKSKVLRYDQILHLRAHSEKLKGNLDKAYVLMDSVVLMTKKANALIKAELIESYSYKEAIQKYNHEKEAFESQKKISVIVWISSIAIIILLVFIFIVLIQKQKLQHKQKKIQLELEKQQVQNQLKEASEKLEKITLSLLKKNEEIQQIQNELESLEKNGREDKVTQERVAYLNSLLSQAIITSDKWVQFKRAFINVHENFIDNLKTKLPEITESEIRYIVLRKMNLNSREIASLLGVQFDTVRLYKYRIKKKYNISDDDLDQLIDGI